MAAVEKTPEGIRLRIFLQPKASKDAIDNGESEILNRVKAH